MKLAIIEDEPRAASALEQMVHALYPSYDLVFLSHSVPDALAQLKRHKVDLLFLDIDLGEHSGFDLLNTIPIDSVKVIFTTAYNQYAIQAFKVNAVDYLLKPIAPTDLKKAIDKASQRVSQEQQLKGLLSARNNTLSISTAEGDIWIPIPDIIRLEADGNYTYIIAKDRKIYVSKNIRYYEEKLLGFNFLRTHKSHIVNPAAVIQRKTDALLLSNEDIVPVAVRRRKIVRNALQ